MKVPAGEILLIVVVALVVPAQEAVHVRLLVGAAAPVGRVVAGAGVPEKVRALRVVGLTAARVVSAREEAVPVTPVVGVRTVTVAAVVPRVVCARLVHAVVAVVVATVAVAVMVMVVLFSVIPVTISVAASSVTPVVIAVAVVTSVSISAVMTMR